MRLGFKQTQVGVIPEEWSVKRIGETADVRGRVGWKGYTKKDLVRSGPYAIGAKHIDDQCRLDLSEPTYLSRAKYLESPEIMLQKGDILIVQRGSIGKLVLIAEEIGEATINPSMAIVRASNSSPSFIRYFLLSQQGQRQVLSDTSSTGVPMITQRQIANFCVAFPPTLEEQDAIATALSDVDALLGGLDRLIAKKRDLKQAAMQQLLTGQTRLPGFSGEWEVKRLGEVGWTYGGLTGKTKADFGVGTGQYVTFMNVMANVVIDCGSFEKVRVSPMELQNLVSKGDLLFNGSSETAEEVAMCAFMAEDVPNLFLNSFCFGFRPRAEQQADGLFLSYYIRANPGRELMKSLAQGSTRYNLSKRALLEASLRLPLKDEQAAIAAVLSGMDAELTALEARRDKTGNLKEAMMQELLTGKTRLVPAGAGHA